MNNKKVNPVRLARPLSNGVNIGLIGAGRIGKLHAENLVKHVEGANLVIVAEIKKKRDIAIALTYKLNVRLFPTADYRNILNDENIDAVVICSSTNTHAQIITEAAQAGKHIFCEKPIDFDLKKIDKALKAVEKSGVKLQIGFNRRFDPDFAQIQRNIKSGIIGDIYKIKIISRDPAPPPIEYIKVSGGIFMDMTIHDFDMARFLADSEPEWIFAHGDVMVDPEIGQAGDIDTAEIIIGFKDGTIVTIDNCRQSSIGYDQRIEVFGSKGMTWARNLSPNKTSFADKKGIHSPKPLYFFLERYKESYLLEMQAFVDAILENKPVPVTGLDGKIPILMAKAAQKSLKEKRAVKISEVESTFAKATGDKK